MFKNMLARVFPRKTEATPIDSYAFYGSPPEDIFYKNIAEVHVSVTFTYDKPKAEQLAEEWSRVAPVKLGGPAYGDCGGAFVPGRYLKPGYVFTSRGCPNNCWFCSVPKREGRIVRELPIMQGNNILDSNLLACSNNHIIDVFTMLREQKSIGKEIIFSGGLEAARLTEDIVTELWFLRPSRMFFAYDTPNDREPLKKAGELLKEADFTRRHLQSYVLIGYEGDTFQKAEERLRYTWSCGFLPMAMLFRDHNKDKDETEDQWRRFQRSWNRPPIVRAQIKSIRKRMTKDTK